MRMERDEIIQHRPRRYEFSTLANENRKKIHTLLCERSPNQL